MLGAQQGKAGEAVHARHVEIEQQGVGLGLALERRLGLCQRPRHGDAGSGEGLAERGRQGVAHHGMVVGDQERPRLGRWIGHRTLLPRGRLLNRAFD